MKDKRTGLDIMSYLKTKQIYDSKNLSITGHSLGGALSPLLMLKFLENSIPAIAYPTAGASTGDFDFAQYAEMSFTKNRYKSVINNMDIVPKAWVPETLKEIPSIYDNASYGDLKLGPNEKRIIEIIAIIETLKHEKITRIYPEIEYVFKEGSTPSLSLVTDENKHFGEQAGYQHLAAYEIAFGFRSTSEMKSLIKRIHHYIDNKQRG